MASGKQRHSPLLTQGQFDDLLLRVDERVLKDGPLLDAGEVAEVLGVEHRTVVYWARKGRIEGTLATRQIGWRFTGDGLRRFAHEHYVVVGGQVAVATDA